MNAPAAVRLSPQRPIPRATYRLQLHREFGFREATLALPYLAALGISHVYCSPYLRATPGSMHGYDVVDPVTINPDLGSPEDFNRFNRELRAYGLAQLLDIVPNHMGIESADNAWWQDVLRNGSSSPYACYFDIDWSGSNGVAPGKLLLPILGADLEQVIAERQLTLRWDDASHAFRLAYFERSLPVNARGAALVYGTAAHTPDGAAGLAHTQDASLARTLADPTLIAAVVACQHYQLAPWQEAATRINYRRFFDVSGLAALRIEDPAVFEATHRQVIELVRAGIVSGLRVDHPDGLRDPASYFRRLQAEVASDSEQPASAPLYIVAEKILAEGEDLPADWLVSGTTGYDFANLACGVLLDADTAEPIDRIWRDFTGEATARFGDMARAAKKEVLARSFGSEMTSLARAFATLLPRPLQDSKNVPLVVEILSEAIACFPVYRTYPGRGASEAERGYVEQACREAGRRLDDRRTQDHAQDDRPQDGVDGNRHHALLAVLENLLTGPTGDLGDRGESDGSGGSGEPVTAATAADRRRAEWAVRFQQLSAPVMAKGVEDTALYRWIRLVSINDVGADPDITGVSVNQFHLANAKRRANWPHAMLATSTHDNKRGEYVRMRINVISEDPGHWRGLVEEWRNQVQRLMEGAGMKHRPSASDLYLLFQTIVGTFPVPGIAAPIVAPQAAGPTAAPRFTQAPLEDYVGRVQAYMTKACRESKLHTSWTAPDAGYEQALHRVVELMLGDADLAARLGQDIRRYAWYGALNSLSLTALKLTVPGVPDTYQGANILDDSLVDPDNRRPVDFTGRQALMLDLTDLAVKPSQEIRNALAGWLAAGDFARLKLWTMHRLLGWRALHPQLFEAGAYVPVPLTGRRARHCIAFVRRNERHGILVLVARLYHQLGFPGPNGADPISGAASVWQDTAVDLDAAGVPAINFIDLLCNPLVAPVGAGESASLPDGATPSLRLDGLLATLPLAVLSFDIAPGRP